LYSGTDLWEENDLPLENYVAAKLTQSHLGKMRGKGGWDIYDKQFEMATT